MRKQKIILFVFVMAGFLSIAGTCNAAIINITSCSDSVVQAAINDAATGDTVVIPFGQCTWNTGLIIPDDKKITLKGQGYNNTIITHNVKAIMMNKSGSRITGIGFVMPTGIATIEVRGINWRIDHCQFTNPTSSKSVGINANGTNVTISPVGLVDHCIFNNCKVLINGMGNFNTQNSQWASNLGLGTSDAIYIEDCTFNYDGRGNCVDTNRAGKYVFRYNTVIDSEVMTHSLQAANERGTRKWEIYNNNFIGTGKIWAPFFVRGGTGVIFNNTVSGQWTQKNIILDNVRSCSFSADENIALSGRCDGNHAADGNAAGKSGYWCRDQIGRSTDEWLWTSEKPYPPQALEPAYFWNNKYSDGSDIGVLLHGCAESQAHIQQNRDWYLNTPKPGYTPYTYPHPLTMTTRTDPLPPKNLKIAQ